MRLKTKPELEKETLPLEHSVFPLKEGNWQSFIYAVSIYFSVTGFQFHLQH